MAMQRRSDDDRRPVTVGLAAGGHSVAAAEDSAQAVQHLSSIFLYPVL